MKYEVILFDLDDTLIDNEQSTKYAFKSMLSEVGEDFTDAKFNIWNNIDNKFWSDRKRDLIKIPDRFLGETGKKSKEFLDWLRSQRVLIYFDHGISAKEAISLNQIYMDSLKESAVQISGAEPLLGYLHDRYTVLVVTNGPNSAAAHRLIKAGLMDYVDYLYSADMFGYMKPRTELFEAIQKRHEDTRRSGYLIVGDSLSSDVGFGMNVGIDSCWYNPNGAELDSYYAPTYIISDLADLQKLI